MGEKKKKILVTGGTGFLGSALVKNLVSSGHQVRVLDNNFRGSERRIKDISERFEMINGDIRNPKIVSKSCKGIDCVFHLAFINGTDFFYKIPEVVLDVGVRGMFNLVDACIKNNVGELFYASSSEVYQSPKVIPTPEEVKMVIPTPFNPRYSYSGGKIISELMTINFGRKYFKRAIIFRPHNIYGPDMGIKHVIPQFILRMKKLIDKTKGEIVRFPVQGTGRETRAFCFINDFTAGLRKLFDKGNHLEIYNIGTDSETSIKTLAEEVAKYFGRKIVIVKRKLKRGSPKRRCPDISKISRLGYIPRVSLETGIKITSDWYSKSFHLKG